MSRYGSRNIGINDDDLYHNVLKKRGVKAITQYRTPTLRRPTDRQLSLVRYKEYVWSIGDRFWRIAQRTYGDRTLWWIIARFNNRPTEGHIAPGETIKIPTNIIEAREVLG